MLRPLLLLIPLLTSTFCIAEESAPFFPVMAWDGPPNDAAVFKRMKDCGFTVAGFVPPAALDNCQAAGLKAIVSDPRVGGYDWTKVDSEVARKQVTELIGEVRQHPAVYGYYLRDEPPGGFFAGLATVSSIVKELHPGAWPYINLFPNYAHFSQLGTPTYDEYVEKFVQDCRPTVLSYDHYAIMEGSAHFGQCTLPIWNRCAGPPSSTIFRSGKSCCHWRAWIIASPPPPTCGSKCLRHWLTEPVALLTSNTFRPRSGIFAAGPSTISATKRQCGKSCGEVNLQIAKLAPTLLKLKSERVYHFGEVPQGCTGPGDQSLVEKIAGPMLVGDFTHENGDQYIMVVNKSFESSITCHPKFRTPIKALEMVSPYGGNLIAYEGEQMLARPRAGRLAKTHPEGEKVVCRNREGEAPAGRSLRRCFKGIGCHWLCQCRLVKSRTAMSKA